MKKLLTLLLLLNVLPALAGNAIHQVRVQGDSQAIYNTLYQQLESRRLFVVFEPDIGRNLAGMAKRLGEDYNRNHLDAIRSLVVCNAWYANKVSNLDPDMLALCPLRVSFVYKGGTAILGFARPSLHAQGSKALPVIREIEGLVIEAMEATKAKFAP
jgi:hypothetical protein